MPDPSTPRIGSVCSGRGADFGNADGRGRCISAGLLQRPAEADAHRPRLEPTLRANGNWITLAVPGCDFLNRLRQTVAPPVRRTGISGLRSRPASAACRARAHARATSQDARRPAPEKRARTLPRLLTVTGRLAVRRLLRPEKQYAFGHSFAAESFRPASRAGPPHVRHPVRRPDLPHRQKRGRPFLGGGRSNRHRTCRPPATKRERPVPAPKSLTRATLRRPTHSGSDCRLVRLYPEPVAPWPVGGNRRAPAD